MNWRILLLFITALTNFNSCRQVQAEVWKNGIEVSEDTISCSQAFSEPVNGMLIIKEEIDLKNRRCSLPKGITLSFQGGIIKNGTMVGDGTRIKSLGVCFDCVRILGTWDVPEISTSMFKDLDYDNSLKDVMALANPCFKNMIVIEPGDYQVTAKYSGDVCVSVCGKTKLTMNGTIRLVPNEFAHYDIIRAEGDSVVITGNGTIIGDKHTHTGTEGEWGMGVRLNRVHKAHVSGLNIRDCWGDCIYVGGKSTDVVIENCLLDHGRRQGISVTSADGVTIRDCTITNVGGTNPEYAIDVEPNKGDVVDHVTIERVTDSDCKGGFVVFGRAMNARVGIVSIRDCQIAADKKFSVVANKCDTLVVQGCDIIQHNTRGCVVCREVGHVEVIDNTLHYVKGILSILKDWARPRFDKKRVKVMEMESCGTTSIAGNQEHEL